MPGDDVSPLGASGGSSWTWEEHVALMCAADASSDPESWDENTIGFDFPPFPSEVPFCIVMR